MKVLPDDPAAADRALSILSPRQLERTIVLLEAVVSDDAAAAEVADPGESLEHVREAATRDLARARGLQGILHRVA